MLNIEAICDDLMLFVRQRYPAQLQKVIEISGTGVPIAPPQASSYYLGEYNRFRPYVLPAFLFVPTKSPRGGPTKDDGNVDVWQHRILLDALVEGHEEEQLTRACFRHAEALHNTLKDQDITRAGVSTRGTKVFVDAIDYGPMITKPSERVFRKDAFLTLRILHYDQATPVG